VDVDVDGGDDIVVDGIEVVHACNVFKTWLGAVPRLQWLNVVVFVSALRASKVQGIHRTS
jgi:hypothetical protein